MHLSFMFLCCLSVFVWLFIFLFYFILFCFIFFCFQNEKKNGKNQKNTKTVYFVYIGTCVPWMAIEIKFSKFCIFCSFDEHLYAQLSK